MTDHRITWMQDTTRLLWAAAALLAPWLVPVGSAIIFGWAMYGTAQSLGMLPILAAVVGIVTAAGLETVNIAAAHAAVQLSHDREQHTGKFWLACILVGFYVVLGIFAVAQLAITDAARVISAAMFLLTPVAIVAQALTLDLARVQHDAETERAAQDAREADRVAWEREREAEREREERAHRLELAKLRWEHKTQVAQLSAEHPPNIADHSPEVREHPPEYAERLEIVRERSAGNPFSPADVQDWLNISRTTVYEVLKYGQTSGAVHQVRHGHYRMNGQEG